MTQREEAYSLLEKLPDKVMGDILKVLRKTDEDPKTWETPEEEAARKEKERKESWEAFLWIENMKKTNPLIIPENYEEVYADAIAEKYGVAK